MKKYFENVLKDTNEQSIIRRGVKWNLISSVLNAGMTALIMYFITLTDRSYLTGFFSIATAIAYQCQSIGFFGVRSYHISDVQKKHKFSDYLYLNIISSFVMILLLIYLSFFRGYTDEKALIIFTYGIYRAVDIFEGIFYDEYQRQDRLDIGIILQTIRFFISLIVLITLLLVTKNLSFACFIATIVSIIVIFVQNKNTHKIFNCFLTKIDKKRLRNLVYICLPIFIAEFINLYLVNASKYAIDANSSNDVQVYFAVLVVPVFTISMLSTIIYRPYITKIAQAWNKNEFVIFKKIIKKQITVIFVLTMMISLFGYIIGLSLLEIIYSVELSQYKLCFILLLIGGGVNTLSVFLNNVLIIIREQNKNMITYIISMLTTFLISNYLVINYSLLGASVLYIIPSLIITILNAFIICKKIYRETKK